MSEFEEAKVVADPEVEVGTSLTFLRRENPKMRRTPLIVVKNARTAPAGQPRHAWPDGSLAPREACTDTLYALVWHLDLVILMRRGCA